MAQFPRETLHRVLRTYVIGWRLLVLSNRHHKFNVSTKASQLRNMSKHILNNYLFYLIVLTMINYIRGSWIATIKTANLGINKLEWYGYAMKKYSMIAL